MIVCFALSLAAAACGSQPDANDASGGVSALGDPADALITVNTPLGGRLADNKAFLLATRPAPEGQPPSGPEVLEIDLGTRAVTSLAHVLHLNSGDVVYSGGKVYFTDSDASFQGQIRIIDVATKKEHDVARDRVGALSAGPAGVAFASRPDPDHTQLSQLDANDQVTDIQVVSGMVLDLVSTDAALFYRRTTNDLPLLSSEVVRFDRAGKTETVIDRGDTTSLAVDPSTQHVYYGLRHGAAVELHDATTSGSGKIASLDLSGASLSAGPIVNHDKILWVQYQKPGEKLMSLPLGGGTPKVEIAIPEITMNTALLASGREGVFFGTSTAADGSYALKVQTF
jgi:hypothetical protein